MRELRARRLELEQHERAREAARATRAALFAGRRRAAGGSRAGASLCAGAVGGGWHAYFDGVVARDVARLEARLREQMAEHARLTSEGERARREHARRSEEADALARGRAVLERARHVTAVGSGDTS